MNAGFLLHMTSGPQAGQSYPVAPGGSNVGRAADNQIAINDSRVSRRHARFYIYGEQLVVQDVGSGNGTFVNGARIAAPTALAPGDSVDLGGGGATLFVQTYAAQTPTAAPPAYAPLPGASSRYDSAAPPYASAQPAGKSRRKKGKGGCIACGGCLGLLALLLVAAGLFLLVRANAPSKNLTLGAKQAEVSTTVPTGGGAVTVDRPGSPIEGFTIHVPAGAYEDETRFTVSTRSIGDQEFGTLFDAVTPLISVEGAHAFSAEPMTVDIPLQLADDEFAMAFFYDQRTGTLEGVPVVSLSSDRLTVLTHHFSDMVISKTKTHNLDGIVVDTGFAPGIDDWQFVNNGSWLPAARGGRCAGQSISAMWYYFEKYLAAGERRLYGRFDNNNYGYGTIDFDEDDSWGIRLASAVQDMTDFDGYYTRTISNLLGGLSDQVTWNAFTYSMALTGEPQYVSIGRYVTVDGKEQRRGHAIVAYSIEDGKLYVADPNYPGEGGRYMTFDGASFQPYASGENAADIAAQGVRVYPEIRYLAKSAMVDFGRISAQYDLMIENKAGQGYFPDYNFKHLVDINETTGEAVWEDCPPLLALDEEDTAEVSEDYRGKLLIGVSMWEGANYQVEVYEGTQLLSTQRPDSTGGIGVVLPLTPGVHDYGFYVQARADGGGDLYYFDFQRVKVIYEAQDLTGTWLGTFRIGEANKAGSFITRWVASGLLMSGLAEDEGQALERAASIIVEAPNMRQDRPLALTLTQPDPDDASLYDLVFEMVDDDGVQQRYHSTAHFEEGVVTFSAAAGDGSSFNFSGQLAGKDSLRGDFSITAWGILKGAASGEWEAAREAD